MQTKISQEFIAQMQRILPNECDSLVDALQNTDPSVSVRINPCKGAEFEGEQVPWCEYGRYLAERPAFIFDPLLHAGAYYVQDASSMIIHHILRQFVSGPVRYLDLCAAPGGKTTAALAALDYHSLVIANEIIASRAAILRENVIKWGYPNAVVCNNAPADFKAFTNFFDVIAIDAPCSGEGMFRKDETAVSQWSPALVRQCAERQRSIINDIWHALRPGGLLIYSTCTFNLEENELMLEHIAKNYDATPLTINTPSDWNIHPSLTDVPILRFMPHRTRGEGLFVGVLRKHGDAPHSQCSFKPKKNSTKPAAKPDLKAIANTLCGDFAFTTSHDAQDIIAYPPEFENEIAMLRNHLKVTHFGITAATAKGKGFIPAHALAMSRAIRREAFSIIDLDIPTALAYLRCEAITLPSTAPRGIVAVAHNSHILGFANNLGSRANNLYPHPWRILSRQ